jgi:anion-transporting  ArsA/GET3 family ATPase
MSPTQKVLLADLLKEHKVLICVGSGGVGKTTLSSSLGVLAARRGMKVLVMTIDPSLRLREALGLEKTTSDIVKVPNQNYSGRLDASLLVSEEIFEKFIRKAAKYPEMAEKLVRNRLYQLLSTTLNGSQEFTALLQLTQIVESKDYDLVILDTPPAQHAVDFLQAPQKLEALFQEGIVRWFLGDIESVGLIRKIVSRGTRTVLGVLEKITGSKFMNELTDFFSSIQVVQGHILRQTSEVQKILKSSDTGFLLITGFDEVKLQEAENLNVYISERNFNLAGVIINRALPDWPEGEMVASKTDFARHFNSIAEDFRRYHAARRLIYEKFIEKWRQNVPVFKISDFNMDMVGLKSLERVADEIERSQSDL